MIIILLTTIGITDTIIAILIGDGQASVGGILSGITVSIIFIMVGTILTMDPIITIIPAATTEGKVL
jgi:hypothetical protein